MYKITTVITLSLLIAQWNLLANHINFYDTRAYQIPAQNSNVTVEIVFEQKHQSTYHFQKQYFLHLPYFEKLFTSDFKEKYSGITILNIHPSAFINIINYIFFNDFGAVDHSNLNFLVDKLEEYGLDEMKLQLTSDLTNRLNNAELDDIDTLINLLSYIEKYPFLKSIEESVFKRIEFLLINDYKSGAQLTKAWANVSKEVKRGYDIKINALEQDYCNTLDWKNKHIKRNKEFSLAQKKTLDLKAKEISVKINRIIKSNIDVGDNSIILTRYGLEQCIGTDLGTIYYNQAQKNSTAQPIKMML